MASSLPAQVVLKNLYNGKYLEHVTEEGAVKGHLRCTGEDVMSPLSKFAVELAESDTELVHLRSCYTNKYLTAGEHDNWIVAEAEKPEEDQSKWSCTLFEPVPYQPLPIPFLVDCFRFKHVKTGNYAVLMRLEVGENPLNKCLIAGWSDPNSDLCDVFSVTAWNSLVVLPRYIAFKGDNDKYLSARQVHDSHTYLQFSSSDSGDESVANEVFPNPDGSIRLWSTSHGMFWRYKPNWIWVSSIDPATFWPVKVDDDVIALRCSGNGNFCKRITADYKDDCLNAAAATISKETRLQVTELILRREISNVEYHLTRARIYDETVSVMGSGDAANTSDNTNSMDVKVAHTESTTTSWSWSVSVKVGVKTTLVTKVPFIAEGKIEISAEVSTTHQWGGSHTDSNTFETVYKVVVPPKTHVTVYALATTGTCDVPFSYTQTDILMDGTPRTYRKHDGLYTGINSFNNHYEQKNEPIDPATAL